MSSHPEAWRQAGGRFHDEDKPAEPACSHVRVVPRAHAGLRRLPSDLCAAGAGGERIQNSGCRRFVHVGAAGGKRSGDQTVKIIYIASGAANMYCGSCMHDNALAAAMKAAGEDVSRFPLYTPMRLDEESVGERQIFYGGIK